MTLTAVVPLRDGVSGKSRLASVLSAADRRALVTVLARHVAGVLLESPQVDRVVIVTADEPFTRTVLDGVPGGEGIEVLPQPGDRPGLNGALEFARECSGTTTAPGAPGPGLLVTHADLPALTSSDIAALTAGTTDVTIATDRVGRGTNLLLLTGEPGSGSFRFHFGEASRSAHEAEARRLGLSSAVVVRPGTAVDLDTTDDWAELPAHVRHAIGRGVTARSQVH
ncbi:2-phospho-L-lactate guanylyltransferase [Myceligenerans crystallogenes]|uniref:Phosphoenolpyruvate guanylyltransferase n=1 Tax=Myceligenerans crystallogenes TaxID=316335 RepID=A0ABN2N9R2_9MICO